MMQPSPACIALIQHSESCELTAYPDPASGGDPWTIGWGATGPGIGPGTVWTQAQADARLAADVALFSRQVSALLGTAPTTQGQFDALVDFAYNEGPENLASSTLLRLHKAGDYAGAAEQFARWEEAKHHVMGGLVTRRTAEKILYLSGSQPVAAVPAPTPLPMIREGAQGLAVRQLQAKLGVPVDGIFGPQTDTAVRAFQGKHGLAVDGVVGAQTWAALG